MGAKFNPPPGWPVPYGFEPPPGWQPEAAWPPAPADWPMWIGSDAPRAGGLTGQASLAGGYVPGYARSPAAGQDPGPAAAPGYGTVTQIFPGQPPGSGGQPPGSGGQPYGSAGQPPGSAGPSYGYPGQAYGVAVPAPRAAGAAGQHRAAGKLDRWRPRVKIALTVSAAVLAVSLVLAMIGRAVQTPGSSPASQRNHHAAQVSLFTLPAGTCFHYPAQVRQSGNYPTYVVTASCSAPHNAQIYASFRARGSDSYPGRKSLLRQGRRQCQSVLTARLDKAKLTKSMALFYLAPLPASWLLHQRSIECIVKSGRPLRTSLLKAHAAG